MAIGPSSDAPTHGHTDAQPRTLRIGLLASHGGSNLGAIVAACREGRIDAAPVVVIGNNSDAFALERARRANIPVYHLSSRTHPDPDALDAAIADALARYEVDLVALAGYMKRLGPRVLDRWRGRIINVHPSLLPQFGGQGMYGPRVHAAVLAAGAAVTGVTSISSPRNTTRVRPSPSARSSSSPATPLNRSPSASYPRNTASTSKPWAASRAATSPCRWRSGQG